MSKPPCTSCPWRRDAPKRLWHPDHFRDVWSNCQDDGTHVMLCHKAARLPEARRRHLFCRGWVLVVGVAAVGVRLLLMTGRLKPSELGRPPGCPGLYRTFRAMLRANGVRAPGRNRVVPGK